MSRREGPATRLSDHLGPSVGDGTPVAILATTFDLDPHFVDVDWLPSVLGLQAKDDGSARSRAELEVALARVEQTVVLTEASRFNGRPKSLRVLMHPKKAEHGVLHAKVTLLVYPEAVRLLVGSANLTPGGYRLNTEVALPITATAKHPEAGSLIRQALDGAPQALAAWWCPEAKGVVDEARGVLDAIRAPRPKARDEEAFLWGGTGEPLWRQVLDRWPKSEKIEKITIVSPFWSASVGDGPIGRLAAELKRRKILSKDAALSLVTAWARATDPTYVPQLHADYGTFDFASIGLRATVAAATARVDPEEARGAELLRERPLHAKCLLLEGKERSLAYVGSANFTSTGWGFGAAANVEAGVVLERSGRDRAALAGILPKTGAAVPLDGKGSAHLVTPAPMESPAPWPEFLRNAELQQARTSDRLVLAVDVDLETAPETWSFSLARESAARPVPGGASRFEVPPTDDELRALWREQVIFVQWAGTPAEGVAFPVNAAASLRERLPFGDPSLAPTEQDLLAFYQGRIDAAEAASGAEAEAEAERRAGAGAAPEQAVDTSRIVAYQIRAFVEALPGIEADIASAAVSAPTITLSLVGPISPVALGKQALEAVKRGRSATAGGFQLVELLALLDRVARIEVDARLDAHWKKNLAEARTRLAALLDEVRATDTRTADAASPFGAYTRVALQGSTVAVGTT